MKYRAAMFLCAYMNPSSIFQTGLPGVEWISKLQVGIMTQAEALSPQSQPFCSMIHLQITRTQGQYE